MAYADYTKVVQSEMSYGQFPIVVPNSTSSKGSIEILKLTHAEYSFMYIFNTNLRKFLHVLQLHAGAVLGGGQPPPPFARILWDVFRTP